MSTAPTSRPRRAPLPVLVVSGFLGTGKTTLVNHLLARAGGRRLAIVVNDFGPTGIDPLLVEGGTESIDSVAGGCLCCAAEDDDLPPLLTRLARARRRVDAVVIEASGLAEPVTLARRVALHPDVRVSALVHVVDAAEGPTTLAQHPRLARHVAAADVVVLNKADTAPDLDATTAWCRGLNAAAPLVRTVEGRLDPRLVLDDPAPRTAPWQPSLALASEGYVTTGDGPGPHGSDRHDGHTHVHDLYTAHDLVADAPLHPARLAALLDPRPPGLFRAKGVVRIAGPDSASSFTLQVVGRQVRWTRRRGPGDGTSRLVCLGAGMDDARVRALLDACPLRPGEAVTADDLGRLPGR
ncbi:CobW family GTP-binding protein [Cellulosimicrobium cellulans]|uniref:CobW family GTP-binding protein n=1 Tax=Cellulosimicrobium cellulans TaxID=1710 RepID=UPI0020982D32|nr:GTP-binding protein [Cellulosimicrobium cellulans]MCO7273667.1 GTP-binding protein [Cellulosimicrobium cellulans]